jgi:anti-sigma regulatory factor (Ser/Thr protein kinase)
MATVHLAFSPDPAYVRTVRLVAAAVARRAGVAADLLDEVRLAIGEACSRAVALHHRHGLRDLIEVRMSDGEHFTVRVTDHSPTGLTSLDDQDPAARPAGARNGAEATEDSEITFDMAVTLLTGLVSDLKVTNSPNGVGSEVEMAWPLGQGL